MDILLIEVSAKRGDAQSAECQNGYARVFYRPDAANYETEQLFLRG